ncbi:MAG: FtsX-like permease family protein [Pseudomonadota bacterium]
MKLSPRWNKLIGDLRSTQGRLAMMVAALALGIFAIATILTSYTILTREISRNYLGTNPASALLELDRIDDALLREVRRQPGIAEAEASSAVLARVEVKPGESIPMLLFVVQDFNAMRLNTFTPESGAWPPPTGTVLLERTALPLVHAKVGATLQVQAGNASKQAIVIAGLVHDPGLAPAWQEQTVYGYITPATLVMLGGDAMPHLLKISVSDPNFNLPGIERTVADLALWLKQRGIVVDEIQVPPPGRHPHQTQMTAILVMFLIFSGMALVLSAVLTATMIGGMLAQQARQIGVMKAIGARSWQIANIYLLLVAGMAAIALLLGLPLGLAAGRAFAGVIAELLNFTLVSKAVPAWNIGAQILVGMLVPLLIALVPIFKATRITVWQAINDFGVGRQAFGSSRFDKALGKIRGIDRTLILAIRNTFRRRGRLALTLGLMAAAGAMFLTSLNVKSAWDQNLADAAADRHYDLEIRLRQPVEQDRLLSLVGAVQGVNTVESWNLLPAAANRSDGLAIVRTYPDGGHGSFTLRSVPPASAMAQLTMLSGRWLDAGDTEAVVLNHMALALFPDAKVGESISLRVEGQASVFKVVGIAREILSPAAAYTTPTGFAHATALAGQSNAIRVALKVHNPDAISVAGKAIAQALERGGIQTKVEISETRLNDALDGHVYILIVALIAMSILMAVVGALGLMSAMGTNVLERTREFGIMRTIGGTSGMVLRNVIGEGIFIGLMSWCIAIVLSIPLSSAVGRLLGNLSFRSPLPLFLSFSAMTIWLLLIVLGALAASAFPAWKASQLTIRETLAHI